MGVVPLFPEANSSPRSGRGLPPAVTAAAPATDLPPVTGGRRGEYALGDIARQLRMAHLGTRTIIAKLRALAAHDRMPLPRTPRVIEGKPVHGPDSIYRLSRWDAGEFDAWLDGRSPTSPAGAPAILATPIREDMRRRAAQLAGAA